MIGFVTNAQTAAAILAGIEDAMTSRGLPNYWTTGSFPIHSGTHAGKVFIPASDEMLATPLRKGATPMGFPETQKLIQILGGLDARVDVVPHAIIDPDLEP